jgi:hypothetical protein
VTHDDEAHHLQTCSETQQPLMDIFDETLILSDEDACHLHRKVNRHDVRIWGKEYSFAAAHTLGNLRNVTFLCNFQKEEVYAIFLRRVKSHWYILS